MAKVEIAIINVPGRTTNVDAEKYKAMKSAILNVTAKREPDITASEVASHVELHALGDENDRTAGANEIDWCDREHVVPHARSRPFLATL